MEDQLGVSYSKPIVGTSTEVTRCSNREGCPRGKDCPSEDRESPLSECVPTGA